jgi:hypothetical protein
LPELREPEALHERKEPWIPTHRCSRWPEKEAELGPRHRIAWRKLVGEAESCVDVAECGAHFDNRRQGPIAELELPDHRLGTRSIGG